MKPLQAEKIKNWRRKDKKHITLISQTIHRHYIYEISNYYFAFSLKTIEKYYSIYSQFLNNLSLNYI